VAEENTENVTKQYRGHVELTAPKPLIAEFVSADLEVLKNKIKCFITESSTPSPSNAPKFESAESTVNPGLLLVYHPQFNRGQTALGWISPEEVPEHMAVNGALDRLREAAA